MFLEQAPAGRRIKEFVQFAFDCEPDVHAKSGDFPDAGFRSGVVGAVAAFFCGLGFCGSVSDYLFFCLGVMF